MQLTVPQRTEADAESFPVEPEGVSRWLSKLDPTGSTSDAMEVYRGLRHSNRLHNDLNRRRAVIACFIPSLRELNTSLLEICQAQPLPLTTEFQRSAQLLDGLLREEAFAYKILLADSPQPRGEDVRQAMQALAKQAQARVHSFKPISESLLRDAHQLYGLAEEFSLLDVQTEDEARTTAEHYKSILLLTLADCRQHRVRQLQPLIEFLLLHANTLRIRNKKPIETNRADHYAIHLKHGSRPVPATSLLTDSTKYVRWLSLSPVLKRIDVQLARSRSQELPLLGAETMDRQSFARLRVTLAKNRRRSAQRIISSETRNVILSHKSICAYLQLNMAKSDGLSAESSQTNMADAYEAMNRVSDVLHTNEHQYWSLINYSAQGVTLENLQCRAGLVQVGELICLETDDDQLSLHKSRRSSSMIGVVRWLSAGEGNAIRIGVEYLAKGVLCVGISRTHSDDMMADDALIVACKVKGSVMQTILLPAYLYQPGDRLTVELNKKTRHVKLNKPLQNNGLFSQFSMLEV